VHWFKSVCGRGVFSCFLKDVMFSTAQVQFCRSFNQRGEKVLKGDFLPYCEGTT